MKFPFSRLVDGTALQPVIDVGFVALPGVTIPALVDSGALQNRFPKEYADRMGLDLSSGTADRFTIAGDEYFCYILDEVKLQVGRIPPFQTHVAFVEGWEYEHGVLGLHGFFRHFSVRFEAADQYCALKRRA